ncbi:MAG TPA: VanZ family protein [Chitinophagaceae bacterium]|jgi:glycopeptide antibiotics resistance protein|nr:VanZ family protein [Chitinophagaceae bacterium]
MNGPERIQRFVLWMLLIFSLMVLTKYILFKKSPHYYKNYFAHQYNRQKIKDGWKHANLKPFSTISLFYKSKRLKEEYKYNNIGGNIVGFVPLGILFPLLFLSLRNIWKITLLSIFLSLMFETIQLLTGLGAFDIDDIILNTTGGTIGYIIYLILKKFMATTNSSTASS